VQKVMTAPPISIPRRKQIELVTSLSKLFSVVPNDPFQTPSPVLEDALWLLKSDTANRFVKASGRESAPGKLWC
jgi:hypothetical protein